MAVSNTSNIRVTSTNGDTLAGPLRVKSIKVLSSGTAGAVTITLDSIVVYNSGTVAINTANYADEIDLMIPASKTATIGVTNAATAFIYLAVDC